MKQANRITTNTISNTASFVLTAIIGFILAPFLLEHLGKSTYGIWVLIASAFTYRRLLTIGLNSAVDRHIPAFLVNHDYGGVNRVLNTTFFTYCFSATLLGIIVAIVVLWMPVWFSSGKKETISAIQIAVCIIGLGVALIVVTNVFPALLSGFQRHDLIAISDISVMLLRTAIIFVILPLGYGMVFVASIFTAGYAVRAILLSYFAVRQFPKVQISFSFFQLDTLKKLLTYSINTFLFGVGQLLQIQISLVLVGILFGAASVPEFSLPFLIVTLMGNIVLALSKAIKPAASHLHASDKLSYVRELYFSFTKFVLIIIIGMAGFFIIYGDSFMKIWLGKNFFEDTAQILTVLVIAGSVRSWHIPAFLIVSGLGYHRRFGIVAILGGVSTIVLIFGIYFIFDVGVFGVAVAYAISEVFFGLVFVAPYCCQAVGVSFAQEMRYSALPAFLATIPYLLILVALKYFYSPNTYLELGFLVLSLATVGIIGSWFLGLTKNEKARFQKVLKMDFSS